MSSKSLLEMESQFVKLRQLQGRPACSSSKASDDSACRCTSEDPAVPEGSKEGGKGAKESSVGWRSRACTGLRVDRRVLPLFKKLCRDEGFTLGRAVEEFMEASIEGGSVSVALNGAKKLTDSQRQADLRVAKSKVMDLRSLLETGRAEMRAFHPIAPVQREESVGQVVESLMRILPRINDERVRKEAGLAVEEAMKYVHEERLRNASRPHY